MKKATTTLITQLCVGLMLLFLGIFLFYSFEKTALTLDEEINVLSIKILNNDIKGADQDEECLRSIIQWDEYLHYQ